MEISCKYHDLEAINELLKSEINEHVQLERQLVEAKIAADERTAACNSLLSDMGHEIRTPMNSIIGMTSILLLDETLTEEQKEFVDTIRVSSDALMDLINDILDYSRLESKRLRLDPQSIELRSFVKDTLSPLAADATKEGHIISHRFKGAVPKRIVQDPARLSQILSSLLVNAIKITDSGKIRLDISSRKASERSEIQFKLSFENNGKSIRTDCTGSLFEAFGMESAPRLRDHSGSDLKLAISKRLAELMDGNIWVESIEGCSPTINFTVKAYPVSSDS